MKISKIIDPYIAVKPFIKSFDIDEKLDYEKWVKYIDEHSDFFTWNENTADGKITLSRINEFSDNEFIEKLLKFDYNKHQAFAYFNKKKGFYQWRLSFNYLTGKIKTDIERKLTKADLYKLIDLATNIGGVLLTNNGKKIIDAKFVEELEE